MMDVNAFDMLTHDIHGLLVDDTEDAATCKTEQDCTEATEPASTSLSSEEEDEEGDDQVVVSSYGRQYQPTNQQDMSEASSVSDSGRMVYLPIAISNDRNMDPQEAIHQAVKNLLNNAGASDDDTGESELDKLIRKEIQEQLRQLQEQAAGEAQAAAAAPQHEHQQQEEEDDNGNSKSSIASSMRRSRREGRDMEYQDSKDKKSRSKELQVRRHTVDPRKPIKSSDHDSSTGKSTELPSHHHTIDTSSHHGSKSRRASVGGSFGTNTHHDSLTSTTHHKNQRRHSITHDSDNHGHAQQSSSSEKNDAARNDEQSVHREEERKEEEDTAGSSKYNQLGSMLCQKVGLDAGISPTSNSSHREIGAGSPLALLKSYHRRSFVTPSPITNRGGRPLPKKNKSCNSALDSMEKSVHRSSLSKSRHVSKNTEELKEEKSDRGRGRDKKGSSQEEESSGKRSKSCHARSKSRHRRSSGRSKSRARTSGARSKSRHRRSLTKAPEADDSKQRHRSKSAGPRVRTNGRNGEERRRHRPSLTGRRSSTSESHKQPVKCVVVDQGGGYDCGVSVLTAPSNARRSSSHDDPLGNSNHTEASKMSGRKSRDKVKHAAAREKREARRILSEAFSDMPSLH